MPSSSRSLGDLRARITWVLVLRTVATAASLGVVALRRPSTGEPTEREWLAFGLIAGVFVLTAVSGWLIRLGRIGVSMAYGQVVGDVVIATVIVLMTGVAESPFTFAYSLAIVEGAVLLLRGGALVAAVLSSLSFLGCALAAQQGWVPFAAALPERQLVLVSATTLLAQALIGVLATLLAREVVSAGGRASAQDAHIKELVGLQNRIVAAMPSGLITCDAAGRVTFLNPSARQILALTEVDAVGRALDEVLPGVSRLPNEIRRAELAVQTGVGSRVLGLAITTLDSGASGSRLVVFQDLTELRRAESDLRRVEHLASLGKLSAQLAHEIRNPLASMRGAAQMLATNPGADAARARLSGILMRESDRLSQLVDDFLEFARPPPPRLAPVDLGRLVTEVVELMRVDPAARQVTVEARVVSVEAMGDQAQLRQVLINLVKNAIAAVGPGGTVRVSSLAGQQPTLSVWDSGGKIPPQDLMRVFEPFYTTREGGTGLGLSTAHSIIQAHGGDIAVSSSPQAGTEFVVRLRVVGEVLNVAVGG